MFLIVAVLLVGCKAGGSESSPSGTGDEQAKGTTTSMQENTPGRLEQTAARPTYEPLVDVVVTKTDPSLPEGCSPRQVAGLVTTFFAAFNEGDRQQLSNLFVARRLYNTPGLYGALINPPRKGPTFSTDSRDELLEYFARRRKAGERLSLLKLEVTRIPEYARSDRPRPTHCHRSHTSPSAGGC